MNKSWNVPVIEMDKKWKRNEKFLSLKSSVLQAQTEVHFTDNKNLTKQGVSVTKCVYEKLKIAGFF